MLSILDIRPFVRTAHYYQFPFQRNENESNRIGYCNAFHLIDRGKGSVTVAGMTYTVKKGDLLYIPPESPHSFYTDSDHPLASYNVYCDLWADKLFNTDQHLVWKPSDFDSGLLTVSVPGTELDDLPRIITLLHQDNLMDGFADIVKHYQNRTVYSDAIASSLLKAFILQLVQIDSQISTLDYRIKAIIERIDKEAVRGPHYDSWLEESGLGKTQFHALFKQATGISPKAYWTKVIMKQAAVILRESNRSVTNIAEFLGYSSIHHFTKQFSAFYGVSPSEFRKGTIL